MQKMKKDKLKIQTISMKLVQLQSKEASTKKNEMKILTFHGIPSVRLLCVAGGPVPI
jgi:hypothetical protein